MVESMATKKVTVTLNERQIEQIRDRVKGGSAKSMSGFVQRAVEMALEEDLEWAAMLAEALEATGGPLTPEEIAWADEVLGVTPKQKRSVA